MNGEAGWSRGKEMACVGKTLERCGGQLPAKARFVKDCSLLAGTMWRTGVREKDRELVLSVETRVEWPKCRRESLIP